jgi:hypothetical protein
MSAQDIADVSGISVTLIRRLLRPLPSRPVRISRTTADAILGIGISTASSRGRRRMSGRGLADAGPAAGLLSELARAGWPASYLADRLNVSTRTIAAIRDQQRIRIRIPFDQALRRLYRQLALTTPQAAGIRPADTARTRTHYQRRCPANTY